MSESNTSSDSTDDEIDPRFDTAFGRRFADSGLEPDEAGDVLAELYDDERFKKFISTQTELYLMENYDLDRDAQDIIREIVAKAAQSSVFPYRNALLSADDLGIEEGDPVFRKITSTTTDYDEPIIKEYEVSLIMNDGTDISIGEVAYYDLEGNVLEEIEDRTQEHYSHPNAAQVAHDYASEIGELLEEE